MGVDGLQMLSTSTCTGREFVRAFNDNMALAVTASDLSAGPNLEKVGRTYQAKVSATNVNTTGRLAVDQVLDDTPLGATMQSIKTQFEALRGWNGTTVNAHLESVDGYKRSTELILAKCSRLVAKSSRLAAFLEAGQSNFAKHTHETADFESGVFSPDRLGKNPTPTTFLHGNSAFG